MRKEPDIPFEDSLNDDWSRDLNMVEVPLGNRPLWALGAVVLVVVAIVFCRVAYLELFSGNYYAARALDNASQSQEAPAPRGIIYDSEGDALVENKAVFTAELNAHVFLTDQSLQSSTLAAAQTILGVPSSTVWLLLQSSSQEDFATPIVLSEDLDQTELVNLQALALSTITIGSDFERSYPNGQVFSSVIGYTGRVTQDNLAANTVLTADDFIGKTGIEKQYDTTLQGIPGVDIKFMNAQGQVLGEKQQSAPTIGSSVRLTIDGGLQTYLYDSVAAELQTLGRQVGVGLAIDPQTGAVLALVNLPGYDNNLFTQPSASNTAEIENLLTSPLEPMFNRAVSGNYNPGSTIKPLDGVAILKEGIVTPDTTLFSPGYLLVPDQYDPSHPTKYMDWRSQGSIDLASALAQSSDVYFYVTVGGSPAETTPPLNDMRDYGIGGLGISKLFDWWTTFGLGKKTGIDLPGEASGFLPTPQWKLQHNGTQWLLGDSYNVAIGQGDLSVTPLQLLSYIDAIANGGKIYRPFLNASSTPYINEDLSYLLPQIQEVQKGMRETVTSPLGTAYTMNDLPVPTCAKTGSAQVMNNQQENALFVGYMPCDNPQIALLILIENSKEGSLNAVPIAKNVFNWYYQNRIASH
jgi:penicillin-binding protein 2